MISKREYESVLDKLTRDDADPDVWILSMLLSPSYMVYITFRTDKSNMCELVVFKGFGVKQEIYKHAFPYVAFENLLEYIVSKSRYDESTVLKDIDQIETNVAMYQEGITLGDFLSNVIFNQLDIELRKLESMLYMSLRTPYYDNTKSLADVESIERDILYLKEVMT